MDEIPVAKREESPTKKSFSLPNNILVLLSGIMILVIGAVWFLTNNNSKTSQVTENNNSNVEVNNNTSENLNSSNNNPPITSNNESLDNVLGHLPYEEVSEDKLKNITNDGKIRLQIKAAEKFLAMQGDARKQGVILVPLSGFRTKKEQDYLFFGVKEKRNQYASKRAEVSAPPGYSEHHTGYAMDIGDGNVPATNLSPDFENTSAYKWLQENAAKYSFELSFPKDNVQGISYEPWHWRYVGDADSLETFYKVHQLSKE